VIRELRFAAPLVYSKRGTSQAAVDSRKLRDRIKRVDVALYDRIARHILQRRDEGHFVGYFGADVSAVPVPGHAPRAPGAIDNTARIAEALQRLGLVHEVLTLLKRDRPVVKSAFAAPADRPKAATHFESLAVEAALARPTRLLLVDDFITRGATLLGAASRLQVAFPESEIRGFALVRSLTDEDIASISAPCDGVVTLNAAGESTRRP
jgi:predicted amidophosphoribosyltransferase